MHLVSPIYIGDRARDFSKGRVQTLNFTVARRESPRSASREGERPTGTPTTSRVLPLRLLRLCLSGTVRYDSNGGPTADRVAECVHVGSDAAPPAVLFIDKATKLRAYVMTQRDPP